MPSGTYVVIDVIYFSTTVLRLFEDGAASVTPVFDESDLEPALDDSTRLTCSEYNSPYGDQLAFINSPKSVAENPGVVPKADIMYHSHNGARCVTRIADRTEESTVFIGSLTNASAVAAVLESCADPVFLVLAGSSHSSVPGEDLAGAAAIERALGGGASALEADAYWALFRESTAGRHLVEGGWTDAEFEQHFTPDTVSLVPEYVDGRFVRRSEC
jgi:2-phosphosulfolactate phosphatase